MNVYTDVRAKKLSPKELREKYGVGYTRIRQLYARGERLCTPTHSRGYGILRKEELARLEPLKPFLEELSTWRK